MLPEAMACATTSNPSIIRALVRARKRCVSRRNGLCSTMAVTSEQIEQISKWARTKPRIELIMLFGSRAKGTHRPDSDIDLAVSVSEKREYTRATIWMFDRFDWQAQLSALIGLQVDIRILDIGEHIREYCAEAGNIVLYEKALPD